MCETRKSPLSSSNLRYLPLKHFRSFVFERPDSFWMINLGPFRTSDSSLFDWTICVLPSPAIWILSNWAIQVLPHQARIWLQINWRKRKKGKSPNHGWGNGIASSSAIERPATTGSSRPSTAASASEIDPARHTVAYRIDIHRIPPRGSSLHATISAPTTPSHSAIALHSFHSEINLGKLPPKLRQSASTKFSLCQELELSRPQRNEFDLGS